MNQASTFKPLTLKQISEMPYEELMRRAKHIVITSSYTMAHQTDMMALLDEIDRRVKSRT